MAMLRFYCFDRHGILPSKLDDLSFIHLCELQAYMSFALDRQEKRNNEMKREALLAKMKSGKKGKG